MTPHRLHNEMAVFDDRAHEALMGVWWVGQLLKKHSRRFFSGVLSSEAQFNVLMLLKYADHPLTQKELSERLFVDKSNLTGLAGRMEAAGLLTRNTDPEDARAYRLELTDLGRATLEQVEQPYREAVHRLMADFAAGELATLTAFMARMQHALATAEGD